MKLQYKLISVVLLLSIIAISAISVIYKDLGYNKIIAHEKRDLIRHAVDSAHCVELKLKRELSITKAFASAPIVENTLIKSNNYYKSLDKNTQKLEIKRLNKKWKKERNKNTPFINSYINNLLAQYLKKQQKLQPNVYGEIFITNKYGVMIATTAKLSTLAHSHKYWWKKSFNDGKGKVFFDDRGFDKSVAGYVIGIVIPIKKDNKIIGILKSNINILNNLQNIIKYNKKFRRGDLKIVRTKGLIILESDKEPLSTTIDSEILPCLNSLKQGVKLIKNDTILSAFAPICITTGNKDIEFGSKPEPLNHLKENDEEMWHAVVYRNKQKALSLSEGTSKLKIYISIIITIILIISAIIISKWIINPIKELKKTAVLIGNGHLDLRTKINSNDEIGQLSKSFNKMLDYLDETMASRDELLKEIAKREEAEMKVLNTEEMIISQSRLAAMGEMISMLAHQWKQPLAAMSMGTNNILADIELDTLDDESLKLELNEIAEQIKKLSFTIDDFRNLFKVNTAFEEVYIQDILKKTLAVISKSLENNGILLELNIEDNIKIQTYQNQLTQILLNVIKNAKEILIERKIENKKITIIVKKSDDFIKINICDNAGGIKNNSLSKIFEPYFSTKNKKNEVGLGLFTSRMIAEKHLKGTIKAFNEKDGACFEIKHPLLIKKELKNS